MSEKIYALLLRLYPAQFAPATAKNPCSSSAIVSTTKPAFLAHLRLWFDLVRDLAVSLPRELPCAPAPPWQQLRSRPLHLLRRPRSTQPPRPGDHSSSPAALAMGGLITFFTLLNYAGTNPKSRISIAPSRVAPEPSSGNPLRAPFACIGNRPLHFPSTRNTGRNRSIRTRCEQPAHASRHRITAGACASPA
jgi:hypothetical protein